MGCQTKIATQILERKADYLLVLKANHRQDYAAVKAHFCDGANPYPTGNLVYEIWSMMPSMKLMGGWYGAVSLSVRMRSYSRHSLRGRV